MNKKISVGMAVSLTVLSAVLTFTLTMLYAYRNFNLTYESVAERKAMYSKLSKIDDLIRQNYFKDIDEAKLSDSIAQGYIAGLDDRWARYLGRQETVEREQHNNGVEVGIGIMVSRAEDGNLLIVGVTNGSPAQADGIKAGDVIVRVDGNLVADLNFEDAVAALKNGGTGTVCNFSIRGENGEEIPKMVTRKEIKTESVTLEEYDGLGYIKITAFNKSAAGDFVKAVDELTKSGVRGLIFDLRGNPGGTIDSVTEMLNRILPAGVLATQTNKGGVTTTLSESDGPGVDLPMAVLINGSSASAAELFAADIRDFGKGPLVGTKTFGKGVMQNTFSLPDGSSVQITTAKFNPHSGVNFDGVGLLPDKEIDLSDEQKKNLANLSLAEDPQFLAAVDELRVE
ncbi:MAG: PDZ domain-containing protein, partial [Oscillospiraceae bacterium]|nr:PDZ domain-containing protein [Oscillospiraceae bacterium]